MPDLARTAFDYAEAATALLPAGPAWPREPDAVLPRLVASLTPTLARLDARAQELLDESPAGPGLVEMLPDWETTLGLPDPCAGQQPTVALRQVAARAKLAETGGATIGYFVALAATLGVAPVTITEFAPSRFGRPFGRSFGGNDWAYAWRVTAPPVTVYPFRFGQGRFGEPFRIWGNLLFECMMRRIKPAHTILAISYTS